MVKTRRSNKNVRKSKRQNRRSNKNVRKSKRQTRGGANARRDGSVDKVTTQEKMKQNVSLSNALIDTKRAFHMSKKLEVARSITSLPEDFKFDVSKWTQALTDIVVNLTEISDLQNLVNNKCDQFSYQRRTIEKFIFGNIETFSNLIETLKKEDNKETLREILKSLREASKGIKNREGSDRNDDKMEILNSESAMAF